MSTAGDAVPYLRFLRDAATMVVTFEMMGGMPADQVAAIWSPHPE